LRFSFAIFAQQLHNRNRKSLSKFIVIHHHSSAVVDFAFFNKTSFTLARTIQAAIWF